MVVSLWTRYIFNAFWRLNCQSWYYVSRCIIGEGIVITTALFPNILTNDGFIVSDCAYTIAFGLKVQPRHSFVFHQLMMDFDGTFPLQKSYRVLNTVFGRNAQTQVYLIRHRMPFEQFRSFLHTQFPKNPSDFPAHSAIKYFLSILRDKYNMILTFPFK